MVAAKLELFCVTAEMAQATSQAITFANVDKAQVQAFDKPEMIRMRILKGRMIGITISMVRMMRAPDPAIVLGAFGKEWVEQGLVPAQTWAGPSHQPNH